ncbi:hypothetical protein BH23CHL2_BH23CHL2_01670 [soil metagenome]
MNDVIGRYRNAPRTFRLFTLVTVIIVTACANTGGLSATDTASTSSGSASSNIRVPMSSTSATLSLMPSEGTCDTLLELVRLEGTGFEPGTETTIFIGLLGGDVGSAFPGKSVAADGTVTIDIDLRPSIGGCDGPSPEKDGTKYFIELTTGTPPDGIREPSASAVFTFHLTSAERFDQTWARLDRPVVESVVKRTWIWGPQAFTDVLTEEYAESSGEQRDVQYFDKSRMEITQPDGDRSSNWYVTNGLLVVEMVTGQLQAGDDTFEQREPATANIAGDLDDLRTPTYATLSAVLDLSPRSEGTVIIERLDRDGSVTSDPSLAEHDTVANMRDEITNHTIAEPFWTFMNASGIVWEFDRYEEQLLFESPFYATGRPITEAYWTTVRVAGIENDVLLQCFERRCLTYTPNNPNGWRVEAGNVGQHYYQWRYSSN